jgi:hypothetical protein
VDLSGPAFGGDAQEVGFADAEPQAGHHEDLGLGEVVDLPLHRPRGAVEPGAATGCPHTISSSPSS